MFDISRVVLKMKLNATSSKQLESNSSVVQRMLSDLAVPSSSFARGGTLSNGKRCFIAHNLSISV